MYCPNCGAKLSTPNEKYCEFCGFELKIVHNNKKEELKVESKSPRSRKKCC